MANARPTLYVGVTNNLSRRVWEHQHEIGKGFTAKYHTHRLVYFECFDSILQAIIREKQLKYLSREEKIKLIKQTNPQFLDLTALVQG